MLLRFLLIILLSFNVYAESISSKYDNNFRKWSAYYNPDIPWYWLKAQCWQESRFKKEAISPVGAKGVCQFMPNTWSDTERRLGLSGDPFSADLNIQFAASYMKSLRRNWSRRERTSEEVHSLALASYNAGLGNILKAQKLSGNKRLWSEFNPYLYKVTGDNSKETIHYVEVIWKYVSDIESNFLSFK